MSQHTERILRHHLRAGAGSLQLAPPGPEAAMRRARQRRRRQRAGMAGVTAIVVAATGLGIWRTTPGDDAAVIADRGVDRTSIDGPRFSWRLVEGTVGWADGVVTAADGTTYALSTAPGARYDQDRTGPIPGALYRTTDGEIWEVTELGDDRSWTGLSERDGVLYAIATAPGEAEGAATAELGTSSDGGASWTAETLPIEVAPPEADVPVDGGAQLDLGVTADLTAALVTATYYVSDVSSAVSERFGRDPFLIWEQTADGIVVSDVSSCDTPSDTRAPGGGGRTEETIEVEGDSTSSRAGGGATGCTAQIGIVPWSELGLSDPAGLTQRRLLLRANGASSWEEVEMPLDGTESWVELHGTSSGLLLAVYRLDRETQAVTTELLRSPDGRNWDRVASTPATWLTTVAGERVISTVEDGSLLISTDGGATFDRYDPAELGVDPVPGGEVWVSSTAAGPLGFAAVVTVHGTGSVSERARAVPDEEPAPPAYRLLTSTDGRSWTATDLGELGVGDDRVVNQVSVGANHVAVVLGASERDASGAVRHEVLLGTPER